MLSMSNCQESHNWVMAFYRATGQAHKPAPPVTTGKNPTNTKNGDADIARKHGMEEYIAADPITFDHALLFKKLQNYSLDWRLSDPFSSLVIHHIPYTISYNVVRVGSPLVKCSCWTSTAPATECVAATDTSVTWKICWISARSTKWSTLLSYTSAMHTVPATSTETSRSSHQSLCFLKGNEVLTELNVFHTVLLVTIANILVLKKRGRT